MTQDMNTLEVLMKARALLSTPERWACGPVELCADEGRQCMVTALRRTEAPERKLADSDAYTALIRAAGVNYGHLAPFNDSHSHPEVLAAYDRAIEAEWEKVQGAAEPVVREPVVA